MSKPTLALIPSGYKSGKVYSILPNDATGDFDFTRQSIGTRVRKDGLIEEAKTVGSITNLQIRSEEFDNSAWIKSDISVTANDTLAPNGTNTADAIVEGTGTGGKIIYDTYTTSLGVYTFSVYIKKEDKRYTAIQVSGSITTSMFNVDLDNGTGQVVAGSFDETNIETLANDWYRVSVTFTATSGTLNNQIYLMNGSAYANRNYTGNGTDKNYVWGAMLSEGALSDYIKTEGTTETKTVETFTDVPRLDWLNSNCPSLLLEPQRTNLQIRSEEFDNSAWSKQNVTIVADEIVAPNGEYIADKLTSTTGSTNTYIYEQHTLSTSTDYSISVFVKKGTSNNVAVDVWDNIGDTQGRIEFNLDTETITSQTGTASFENYGNGWYRLKVTFTTDATLGTTYFRIRENGDINGAYFYLWGAMLEQGSYCSSYIKTEASTVTRLADECNNAGTSDLFNSVEGVLYAEIAALADDGTNRNIALSDGSTSNRIVIVYTSVSNQIRFYLEGSGGTITVNHTLTDISNFVKVAVKYKPQDFSFYVNGVEVDTNTLNITFSGLNDLSFYNPFGGGTSHFYGKVKDLRYYDTALTDAELTELTT